MNDLVEENKEDLVQTRLMIPKERVAVLIGKKGVVKKRIEEELGVQLEIDSSSGEVVIKAPNEKADMLVKAATIVKAIGRGFSPENALLLKDDEYTISIIDLTRYAPTRNALIRIRGRIIGRKGKSRLLIEELTGTKISVYGKTVAIIGPWDKVGLAEDAIRKLAEGARHATVFDWLYEQRRIEKFLKMDEALRAPYRREPVLEEDLEEEEEF